MGAKGTQSEVRRLLFEEIERIVTEAAVSGSVIRAGYHAGMLAAAYPDTGLSLRRIIEELVKAGDAAKVIVEIGPL